MKGRLNRVATLAFFLGFAALVGSGPVGCAGYLKSIGFKPIKKNDPADVKIAKGAGATGEAMQTAGKFVAPFAPVIATGLTLAGAAIAGGADSYLKRRQVRKLKQPRQQWTPEQRAAYRVQAAQVSSGGENVIGPLIRPLTPAPLQSRAA